MANVNETLAQRATTHGSFSEVSRIAQTLKSMRDATLKTSMSDVQTEAFDMIASKIGRILSGNPNEKDHWHDIAGYASLVVKYLEEKSED